MRDRPGVLVSVGILSVAFTAGVVTAQERTNNPAPAVDRAMEVVRREARARAREREEAIERIKLEPVAPAVVANDAAAAEMRIRVQVQERFVEQEGRIAKAAVRPAPGRRVVVLRRNLVLAPVPRANKGDDDEPEDEVQPPPRVLFTEENFERQLFMNMNIDEARDWLNTQLRNRLAQVERSLRLSPAQKERLRLAGQGDIKRFFDQVDEHRRVFDRDELDLQEYQEFIRGLAPLCLKFQQRVHFKESFYEKTLKRVQNEVRAARNQAE
jgi:hypothetical protein